MWKKVTGTTLLASMLISTGFVHGAEEEEKEKLDPQKVVMEAGKLFAEGKGKEAVERVEALVKQDPKSAQFRVIAAQLNHQVGIQIVQDEDGKREDANPYLFRCAKHMRQFKKLTPGDLPPQLTNFYAVAIYNEACSLAVQDKKDKALKVLEEAIDAGFEDLDVLKDDEDFKSVKDDPKFKALVKKLADKNKIRT